MLLRERSGLVADDTFEAVPEDSHDAGLPVPVPRPLLRNRDLSSHVYRRPVVLAAGRDLLSPGDREAVDHSLLEGRRQARAAIAEVAEFGALFDLVAFLHRDLERRDLGDPDRDHADHPDFRTLEEDQAARVERRLIALRVGRGGDIGPDGLDVAEYQRLHDPIHRGVPAVVVGTGKE